MGDELCPDRLPAGSGGLRESQRPLWPETPANPGCATLRNLLRWHRAGQRISPFCDVANRWGMAIGLASNLSPMYIAEISPAAVRGKLVSLNQLTIVLEFCWPSS